MTGETSLPSVAEVEELVRELVTKSSTLGPVREEVPADEARKLIDDLLLSPIGIETKSYMHLLGAWKKEIPHSRFVAWLLSPHDSHGLGDGILRTFLSEVQGVPITGDLTDVEVRRERTAGSEARRLLDIRIVHEDFLIGVENKIMAPVEETQLIEEAQELLQVSENRDVYLVLLSPRRYKIDQARPLEEIGLQAEKAGIKFRQIDYNFIVSFIEDAVRDTPGDERIKWMLQDYLEAVKEAGIVSTFEGFHDAVKPYIKNYAKMAAIQDQFRKDQKSFLRAILEEVIAQSWFVSESWDYKERGDGTDFFRKAWNGGQDKGVKFHVKASGEKLQRDLVGISLRAGSAVDRTGLKKALERQTDEITKLKAHGLTGLLPQRKVIEFSVLLNDNPVQAAVKGLLLLRPLAKTIDSLVEDKWAA